MNKLKKLVPRGVFLAVMCLFVAACGPLAGLRSDPMSKVTFNCSIGYCTADQWVIGTVAVNLSNDQQGPQTSGPGESAVTGGVAYGVPYGAAGFSQELAYAGADGGAAAIVSGVTGLAGGGVNGLMSWSYGNMGVTSGSAEDTLRDWENGKAIPPEVLKVYPNVSDIVVGLHVKTPYVRTKNSTKDHLPYGWHGLSSVGDAKPAFSGPKVGAVEH